jgi:hypothetical protein
MVNMRVTLVNEALKTGPSRSKIPRQEGAFLASSLLAEPTADETLRARIPVNVERPQINDCHRTAI